MLLSDTLVASICAKSCHYMRRKLFGKSHRFRCDMQLQGFEGDETFRCSSYSLGLQRPFTWETCFVCLSFCVWEACACILRMVHASIFSLALQPFGIFHVLFSTSFSTNGAGQWEVRHDCHTRKETPSRCGEYSREGAARCSFYGGVFLF